MDRMKLVLSVGLLSFISFLLYMMSAGESVKKVEAPVSVVKKEIKKEPEVITYQKSIFMI